jgi:hypothetical protein
MRRLCLFQIIIFVLNTGLQEQNKFTPCHKRRGEGRGEERRGEERKEEMNGQEASKKRQRLEEEQPDSVDLKLSQELQELMGGRTYIKEEELTRTVLLEWAKRQGAVKVVNLISITV